MTPRRWLLATVAAIAVLLVAGRVIADVYTDYAWYSALGATAVWRAHMGTVAIARLVGLFSASAFAFANLLTVRRSVVALVLQRQVGNIQIGENVPPHLLTTAAATLSLILGGVLAFSHAEWTTTVLARSGVPFHELDPYFNQDLGFFVYWLPFESALWNWAVIVVSTVAAVVLTLYVLTDGLRLRGGKPVASAHVRRHVTALVGLSLLLLAWHFRLEMYELLLGHGTSDAAFSTLDQHVGINGAIVLVIAAMLAGVTVLWTAASGQFRLSVYAVAGVFALWVLVRQVAPILYTELTNRPNSRDDDRQHVATQAGYTQRAFGVDKIVMADSTMVYPTLGQAVNAIQLWDPPALRRAIAPTRVPDSSSSWIGWRATPAGLVADVVVRGEERDTNLVVPWLVARVDGSAVDPDGGPVDVADPSATASDSRIGSRGVSPPLVFPGASTYRVLTDSLQRISGIPMAHAGIRVALAWNLQQPRFLFDTLSDQASKLVMHRDLRDRIDRLVPFFVQGTVITPIVVGDSLYWAIDLYSASAWYPLSHRVTVAGRTWSFFHHAAVAIVEGRTGDVLIVPDLELDPIAKTWVTRFQPLFTSWSALPAAVQTALPPAIDAAHVRAVAFGRVGAGAESVIPRRPPAADRADRNDRSLLAHDPVFMLSDGSATAVSLPLVDGNEEIGGTLVVTGGRDPRAVWIPNFGPPIRWSVVVDQLRTLDSSTTRHERQLAHGPVRTIPTRRGLSYLQPVFDWPSQSAPSLDYVVFVDGDSARRTPSLRDVIGAADGGSMPGGTSGAELRTRIGTLYDAMRAAQQRGDWAAYGRAFEALGRILGRVKGR